MCGGSGSRAAAFGGAGRSAAVGLVMMVRRCLYQVRARLFATSVVGFLAAGPVRLVEGDGRD